VEQGIERVDVFWMMHPHYPFAPGEIDNVVDQRDRGELPVQDGHRRVCAGIEKEVLRPEVSMTDTGTMNVLQHGSACGQYRLGMPGCDEILAVPAADEPQRQRMRRAVEDRWHRDTVTDQLRSSVFLVEASCGVRTGVGLHDHHTNTDCLVGVAVCQPLHLITVKRGFRLLALAMGGALCVVLYPKPIPYGGMGDPVNQNGFAGHFPITVMATEVD
jgi:hypothetical protein